MLVGHPRFLAYIVGAPAPIGALADLLAAAVNQNVGAWHLAPMAAEIEAQSVRWIAELIGFPVTSGGLLTSGGNVANFVGFLAARDAKAPWPFGRRERPRRERRALRVYTTEETHTWIHKAADLFGLGTDAIRFVAHGSGAADGRRAARSAHRGGPRRRATPVPGHRKRRNHVRRAPSIRSRGSPRSAAGRTSGSTSTPPTAASPPACEGAPADLAGLALADSVAVDPHKWLYVPLEAGCALVRDRARLRGAFEYRPPYYPEAEAEPDVVDYHAFGLQNSRGFRALKVWLALRQSGSNGYRRMIARDIALGRRLFDAAARHPELEAVHDGPLDHDVPLRSRRRGLGRRTARRGVSRPPERRARRERSRPAASCTSSHAVIGGRSALRTCIVNFRTSEADVDAIPEIVARAGRAVDARLRAGRS